MKTYTHGNIELIVAQGRRASTELKIESFGRSGEDPRALTSEGHIDSLGLCIFLAFVRKFNEECPLIVLDDVVTTVDARHREHICELLLEEFGDRQLIITTHDEIWYEQLRAAQRAYRMEGSFKNLAIVGWSVDVGPRIRPYKPRWERIQGKIQDRDKPGAGNAGRQYLEWVLYEICHSTRAGVPLDRSGRYEITDLLGPAKIRLEALIKDDTFKGTLRKSFDDLERTSIMGNILSHNNPLAPKTSMDEVASFCEAVRSLHLSFSCRNCDNLMSYYRDLKILRCSSAKCKKPTEVRTN